MPDDRRGVCREPDSQGEKPYGVRGMKMCWENGRRYLDLITVKKFVIEF